MNEKKDGKTFIVFSSDLDKVLAAFNLAVGSASMGFPVTMYFTFWGLSVLRKENHQPVKKSIIDHCIGFMLPKGESGLVFSKMNYFGMGTWMMKILMRKRNLTMLPELMKVAKEMNVNIIACDMAMKMMGIKKEELIDGITFGGVAAYLKISQEADLNLFI